MRRALILAVFFLSGAAGLIYQVAWARRLTLILGVTSQAVAIVLAVFMGGLALGAWWLGGTGDRARGPLRLYGWLELGIGAAGIASPFLLDGLYQLYAELARESELGAPARLLLRLAIACAALLVPTTLMGATLPVLLRGARASGGSIARATGLLYAVNTLGAVVGTLAASFVLIQQLGLRGTIFGAAAVNVVVGLIALVLGRGERVEPEPANAPLPASTLPAADAPRASAQRRPASASPPEVRAVLAAFAASGFLALAYEVLWTRYLIYVLGENSVYAFSLVLACFLLGIVLGSLLASWLCERVRDLVGLFGAVQLLIGAAACATVLLLSRFAVGREFGVPGLWMHFGERVGKCLAVLIVPATLSGSTFAIVAKLYARQPASASRDVGRAYAANTLGAILGALAGGFVVLPMLQLRGGMLLLGSANVLLGLWLLLRHGTQGRERGRRVLAAALLLLAISTALAAARASDPAVRALTQRGGEVVFYGDGPESSVAVTRSQRDGSLMILVDGDGQAGTGDAMQVHLRLLGHLPALFHPAPRKGLCIAFGAGISLGCLAQHPFERVDLVELSRTVLRAAPHFAPYNHDPLHDPRVRLIVDDGRNHLLTTAETYDVITADPIDPDDAGVTSLFCREYYELVSAHLDPGGIACQWVTSQYDPDEYRMLVRTFQSVFPHTLVFYADFTTVVIGLKDGPQASLEDLRARCAEPRVRESLAVIGIDRPEELLALCIGTPSQVRAYCGEGPLNTDDRPLIEYLGPIPDMSALSAAPALKPLFDGRRLDLAEALRGWSLADEAAFRPEHAAMAALYVDHVAQEEDFLSQWLGGLEERGRRSAAERDQRALERRSKRAEHGRASIERCYQVLADARSRLQVLIGGFGRYEPEQGLSAEARVARAAASGRARLAWNARDWSGARADWQAAAAAAPRDTRARVLAAACLDEQGDALGALRELLQLDTAHLSRWSGLRQLDHALLEQVVARMPGLAEAERAQLGRTLLELTPVEAGRPPARRRGQDRTPHARPTSQRAAEADAWWLWLLDARSELDVEGRRFVWGKPGGGG